jgi:putative isomerase
LLKGLTAPGRFITKYGLAGECPQGPLYETDGYWRGGIWGASTLIIVDGLQQIGETTLAVELAEKFCSTYSRSGMAENFDALTGESRSDPAYTWTSSIFQIFARGTYKE